MHLGVLTCRHNRSEVADIRSESTGMYMKAVRKDSKVPTHLSGPEEPNPPQDKQQHHQTTNPPLKQQHQNWRQINKVKKPTHDQPTPPSQASSPTPSSNYQ
jgi:hypothetical protein